MFGLVSYFFRLRENKDKEEKQEEKQETRNRKNKKQEKHETRETRNKKNKKNKRHTCFGIALPHTKLKSHISCQIPFRLFEGLSLVYNGMLVVLICVGVENKRIM